MSTGPVTTNTYSAAQKYLRMEGVLWQCSVNKGHLNDLNGQLNDYLECHLN